MENINHLLNNENILWETSHRAKFDERLKYLLLAIFIIFTNLVFTSPLIQFGGNILTFILLEIGIFFNFVFIVSLLFDFFSKRKGMKKYQLTWKDLYKYEIKGVLTIKGWIQKGLDVSRLKESNYLMGDIKHYKDFVLITLVLIKHIEITEYKEFGKMKYVLRLYFSYDKTLPKKVILGMPFTSEDQFQILVNSIKRVMEVKREEKLHRRSGSNVYDFYF